MIGPVPAAGAASIPAPGRITTTRARCFYSWARGFVYDILSLLLGKGGGFGNNGLLVKHVSTIALIVIFLLLGFALSQSITTMVSLSEAVATGYVPGNPPTRHVSVFLPDQATLFFEDDQRQHDVCRERKEGIDRA